jgi:ATP-dependent DNA ligase
VRQIMIVCRWLEPRLVAAIEFLEWTPENHLRHSRFVALRQDKEADRIRWDGTS